MMMIVPDTDCERKTDEIRYALLSRIDLDACGFVNVSLIIVDCNRLQESSLKLDWTSFTSHCETNPIKSSLRCLQLNAYQHLTVFAKSRRMIG